MGKLSWYIFILFLVFGYKVAAQKEPHVIDSLKLRVKKPKNDSNLCYLQDVLAKEYFETNLDSAISYGKKSLKLSRKLNVKEYQVDAFNTLGIASRKKGDFKSALQFHYDALKLIQSNKLDPYYFQSVYSCICLAYTEQGNYSAAIEYGYKALRESEKQNDTLNQAINNNNLADIYFNTKHYNKAMLHYKKALVIATQQKNVFGQGLLAGNIGSVYYENGKLDSAKLFFEKSLQFAVQLEDVLSQAWNYENLGSYYQRKKNNAEALSCFLKAKKIFEENQMDPDLSTCNYNLATVYLESGDYQKSKEYAEISLQYANKINSYPNKQSAHEALKNVFEKLNNIPMAYLHYKEYVAARDSIFNQENRNAQFKSELEYEYAKKRDVDSLNQVIATKIQQEQLFQEQVRTQTQRKFTYIAMAGCLVLLVLVIFVFKGYRDKQKANTIITAQKKETEFQKEIIEEKQKEILDSIHYAKRIQQSLLPSEKYIERVLYAKKK